MPKQRRIKPHVFIAVAFITLCLFVVTILTSNRSAAPVNIKRSSPDTIAKSFDKNRYSQTDPSSPWVVVNKQHPINPLKHVPSDLNSVNGSTVSRKMAPFLSSLVADAKAQGITLKVISGYRSYDEQTSLYRSYVAREGQTKADTYSARPGHSEHQTGLAVDLGGSHGCDLEQCFGDTPEGKWLALNAYTYGFIVRYNGANQSITGYQAEPWHLRYVGSELAVELKKQSVSSLEQFFGISGGSIYLR